MCGPLIITLAFLWWADPEYVEGSATPEVVSGGAKKAAPHNPHLSSLSQPFSLDSSPVPPILATPGAKLLGHTKPAADPTRQGDLDKKQLRKGGGEDMAELEGPVQPQLMALSLGDGGDPDTPPPPELTTNFKVRHYQHFWLKLKQEGGLTHK